MQPRKSPLGVRDILLWSLCLALAAALQQQPHHAPAYPSKAAAKLSVGGRYHAKDSLHTPLNGERKYRDTHVDNARTTPLNERALATLSPADNNAAVRAPPAPRSSATGGLSSRLPARSLQDWKVEDIILLATVDGKLHARDRNTGASRWQFETDQPMVETTYHPHNKSLDENGLEMEDAMWIVEPSQDGAIYLYVPGSVGMQYTGLTVRYLEGESPYATDVAPYVVFTADKKTTLYTVDAATGNIMKQFSSAGSITNTDMSCRRVNPLESLDEEECESIGTLMLGRTEYTVAIQDRETGEPISTIRYFEWGPNERDKDLKTAYIKSMDEKYVYTRYDGTIFGIDRNRAASTNKAIYRDKLSAPVARIFDVMRPAEDTSSDPNLVILPQPVGPIPNGMDLEDDISQRIYVNCTSSGSWYALSETNYPAVTDGAVDAKLYGSDLFGSIDLPISKLNRDKFAGLHQLATPSQRSPNLGIGGADYPGIEGPPPEDPITEIEPLSMPTQSSWGLPSTSTLLLTILIVLIIAVFQRRDQLQIKYQSGKLQLEIDTSQIEVKETLPEPVEQEVPTTPKIRDGEPAVETVFPHLPKEDFVGETSEPAAEPSTESSPEPAADALKETPSNEEDTTLVPVETNEPSGEEEAPKGTPVKGKHKRGKRGGRKQKEKEQAQAEAKALKTAKVVEFKLDPKVEEVQRPAEVISVAASESPQVSGSLQINSLVINTDRVIGQGSCGTSVFEGSFEGRDVAVKRMLSQYYELASQEVSFLQQSDDHPNVVRYFCQQKDDHFLYIAVELCQASLFEVWEAEKARTEERQTQLRTLKMSIQQDIPRALEQLAAGLYHLHNLRIIHRDIKPQNILVAFPKRNQNTGPRLVISDFGLGKNLPENVSTLIDPTGNAGTSGWKAPELISQPRETNSQHSQQNNSYNGSEISQGGPSGVKRAADIFSLGCLFFWVLTDGAHPFEDENGWQQLRELNIKRDHKKMDVLERWSDAYEPMQLITSMLEHQPENRPTALQVLNHPFFWSAEKRLAFLCDVSDHFEREPRGVYDDGYAGDSYHLCLLEDRAPEVIGKTVDFLGKLDRQFVDTLGKQRKYSGNRLLDLLRALRNKKNHYEDMPPDVKRRVGPLAGGYLNYWCHRFPRLLMSCYEVIHEAGVQNNDRFKGYFVMGA